MSQTRPEKFIQRTASHLRWLLDERAIPAGEIERRQERIDRLAAEQRALQEKIDALDVTIGRSESLPTPTEDLRGSVRMGVAGAGLEARFAVEVRKGRNAMRKSLKQGKDARFL